MLSALLLIAYLSVLVASIVFIGLVLTGKIRSLAKAEYMTAEPMYGSSIEEELYNPALMWIQMQAETRKGTIKIPTPIFRWSAIEEFGKGEEREDLQRRFLQGFAPYIQKTRIYAASHPAFYFLREIEDELEEHQASVAMCDPLASLPPAKRTVLFDTSIGTANTLLTTMHRLPEQDAAPKAVLLLVLNDFIPQYYQKKVWSRLGVELKHLYTASQLAQGWSEERQPIAAALLTVRDAQKLQLDWRDVRVQMALDTLRGVLNH